MGLYRRLLARLLHWANSDPPFVHREQFYALKDRLCQKYARFVGHDMQEITKPCYGDGWWRDFGPSTPCGPKCVRCGGTGVYSRRWVRLERWAWGRFMFHKPAGDTWKQPESVQVFGRVKHRDYGRLSGEARLWLYLLAGEWRLFRRAMRSSRGHGWHLWPLLTVQKLAFETAVRLRRATCLCGRRYWTKGGWLRCRRCRAVPVIEADEVPF